jgi:carbonic anhydrase
MRHSDGGSWPDLPPRAQKALAALLAGNARFRAGHPRYPHRSPARRRKLAAGQHPTAAFFGCIDSRVPDETVLDQGLGDLLTIRTAGHTLDTAALGSLEFGVHQLKIPLIMVLGHESCGAVAAAIGALEHGAAAPSAIADLVEIIRPAVEATRGISDRVSRLDAAVRRHTRQTVADLLERSRLLAAAVGAGQVGVVAARYSLKTGEITPA